MSRTGERRTVVALRLDKRTIQAIDERAEVEGLKTPRGAVNRSEMLRLAWLYAQQHMPKGWRPPAAG